MNIFDFINKQDELKQRILKLQNENDVLKRDLENKENSIINLLDANKEFCLANSTLRETNNRLRQIIDKKDLINCELNTKLKSKEEKLKKIMKWCNMKHD